MIIELIVMFFIILVFVLVVFVNFVQFGYIDMMLIQVVSLFIVFVGYDLIVQVKMGSGKIVVFVLVLFVWFDVCNFDVQVMVFCFMCEFVDQVVQEICCLVCVEENVKVFMFCGGMLMCLQVVSFEYGVYVVVGMLGCIMDYLECGNFVFGVLKMFVFDEVDCMFDMGFFDDIVMVVCQCLFDCQMLLFLVMYLEGIVKLSQWILCNLKEVKFEECYDDSKICQCFYEVIDSQWLYVVGLLFKYYWFVSMFVFCNMKQ